MSGVRVLVGTRKGFVLTSDERRATRDEGRGTRDEGRCDAKVDGPHFGGWEACHLKGSPAVPDRIWASQWTGWFGQLVQRSNDGGRSWNPVGSDFQYGSIPGTHQWYDGPPHPWESARVWHLEPSLTDRDTVYAGVEDAALFKTTVGGESRKELPGLREHGSGPHWQPVRAGCARHAGSSGFPTADECVPGLRVARLRVVQPPDDAPAGP